jgi:pimeloyl-ACP methyl ester carboxylesterase
MRVRDIEQPFPWDEPAPAAGYFAPPSNLVVGNEWRLIQQLRDATVGGSASTLLTEAVVAQVRHALVPSPQGFDLGLGMAFADLAVTGRRAFADFVGKAPQEGGPIEAAAMAKLTTSGLSGVTPQLVRKAMSAVLDRAYQVAWFLRAETTRGDLGWIAVSGEDDLPHRPVNVPRTSSPQHDLYFTVPGDSGDVVVQTRYAIATATDPDPTTVSLPKRRLPPVTEPALPGRDRIILFIDGSDSRLEEAATLIPKLVRLPDGRPSGFAVLSVDLPGSGYVNPIDHTEVGAWPPAAGTVSMLPFLEKFILRFVATLSTRLGQPGVVESRIAAVIGGSLGGNLALRLARRRAPWLRNAVAWSPGSVWRAVPDAASVFDRTALEDIAKIQAGMTLASFHVGLPEAGPSRDLFFYEVFDMAIPDKTQPEQWYREDFPAKQQFILDARLDRRETYTPQFRHWHWRVSLEELVWSWQDARVQDFHARVLLGAGSADDIAPARIFTNTRKLATELAGTNGDTFFFDRTGHSVHAERPEALARTIFEFLAERPPPSINGIRSEPAWELLLS